MKVYFVRHGESVGNKEDRHQGSGEPLSEKGKKQAKLIAKRLSKMQVDVIYASPFERARQTAKVISKELDIKIEYWEGLRERKKPSEIEGLSFDDPEASKIDNLMRKNQVKPDWSHSDSESFNQLINRAKSIEEHLLSHHKGQNVLCVSHLAIMKFVVLHIILQDKLTPEVFWQFYYHSYGDNTGITELEYTKKYGWTLETWNDTTHL